MRERRLLLYVNPGTGTAPAPIPPNLNFAGIQLIGPNNTVLASGNSTSLGAAVSLPNITLPTDGVYSINISDAAGRTDGHRQLHCRRLGCHARRPSPCCSGRTPTARSTLRSTSKTGHSRRSPASKSACTSINQTSTGLLYTLTGPNGFVGFTNLSGDSPLVNLTETGAYTLAVQGLNGATGNYSFVVNPTTQTSMPLNGIDQRHCGRLEPSGTLHIDVPTAQSLTVLLDDQSAADSNEMYLRFGAPPTRETFDYRYSNASAADQTILVPHAAVGTWYVLVYGDNVPVQSNFSLSTVGEGSASRQRDAVIARQFRPRNDGDHRRWVFSPEPTSRSSAKAIRCFRRRASALFPTLS